MAVKLHLFDTHNTPLYMTATKRTIMDIFPKGLIFLGCLLDSSRCNQLYLPTLNRRSVNPGLHMLASFFIHPRFAICIFSILVMFLVIFQRNGHILMHTLIPLLHVQVVQNEAKIISSILY